VVQNIFPVWLRLSHAVLSGESLFCVAAPVRSMVRKRTLHDQKVAQMEKNLQL
jgi:hypothetical protein